MMSTELPVPPHFRPQEVGKVWRVPYQEIAEAATAWAGQHHVHRAARDKLKLCLLIVDVQNTFCIPGFELYVAGRSGTAAVDDNRRLCNFIYRNLALITQVVPTLDTHQAMQIFHSVFLINDDGEHPAPYTLITAEDISQGRWKFNPAVGHCLSISPEYGQRHLEHYSRRLQQSGKYELTVWPYHAMLGGIGHALVSAVEEAIFFHAMARYSQPHMQIKGNHPLTEHYSVLGPEVAAGPDGERLTGRTDMILDSLVRYDAVIVTGQAKSHCVAWTIKDLLADILAQDKGLVEKIYLLEDCTSPVVVPGVVDYTEQADAAFRRFADQGMHVVRSTDPVETWPGIINGREPGSDHRIGIA